MFWKNKKILLPRVSGNLKPVEYAGKNRFSKYSRFLGLNRPWSLVITHSHLTWTMICFRDSYAMHTFSLYFFQLNRAHASQWEYIWPRSSVLLGGDRIWNIFTIKLQGRFRPKNGNILKKWFLPAYSTGFKVPETHGGNNFLFFQNSIRPCMAHHFTNTIIGSQFHEHHFNTRRTICCIHWIFQGKVYSELFRDGPVLVRRSITRLFA